MSEKFTAREMGEIRGDLLAVKQAAIVARDAEIARLRELVKVLGDALEQFCQDGCNCDACTAVTHAVSAYREYQSAQPK